MSLIMGLYSEMAAMRDRIAELEKPQRATDTRIEAEVDDLTQRIHKRVVREFKKFRDNEAAILSPHRSVYSDWQLETILGYVDSLCTRWANVIKEEVIKLTHGDVVNDFGWALRMLKSGRKVARDGWNGKNMWIVMMPELSLPPHNTQESGARMNDRTSVHIGYDTPLECMPYIAMWTAQGTWQPGWHASKMDMFGEDWYVVE